MCMSSIMIMLGMTGCSVNHSSEEEKTHDPGRDSSKSATNDGRAMQEAEGIQKELSKLKFTNSEFAKGLIAYVQETEEQKKVLLEKTDHTALLLACREMIKKRSEFKSVGPARGIRREDPSRTWIAYNDPKLPEIIRSFGPNQIIVTDDWITVGLDTGHMGFGFGVEASREGSTPAFQNEKDSVVQWKRRPLVEGLLYYEYSGAD